MVNRPLRCADPLDEGGINLWLHPAQLMNTHVLYSHDKRQKKEVKIQVNPSKEHQPLNNHKSEPKKGTHMKPGGGGMMPLHRTKTMMNNISLAVNIEKTIGNRPIYKVLCESERKIMSNLRNFPSPPPRFFPSFVLRRYDAFTPNHCQLEIFLCCFDWLYTLYTNLKYQRSYVWFRFCKGSVLPDLKGPFREKLL